MARVRATPGEGIAYARSTVRKVVAKTARDSGQPLEGEGKATKLTRCNNPESPLRETAH